MLIILGLVRLMRWKALVKMLLLLVLWGRVREVRGRHVAVLMAVGDDLARARLHQSRLAYESWKQVVRLQSSFVILAPLSSKSLRKTSINTGPSTRTKETNLGQGYSR